MAIYVTVSEGPSPTRQRVIFTSGDSRISEAVFDALARIDAERGAGDDPDILPASAIPAPQRPAHKVTKGRISPLRHPYLVDGGEEAGR